MHQISADTIPPDFPARSLHPCCRRAAAKGLRDVATTSRTRGIVGLFKQWLPIRWHRSVMPLGRDFVGELAECRPARAVLELGGGTGALTRALLAHGIRGDALLVLELNEELHAHLHARFPRVRIALGDAQQLPVIARQNGFLAEGPVDAIVSGLGLLSMPRETQGAILEAAFAAARGRHFPCIYGPSRRLPTRSPQA